VSAGSFSNSPPIAASFADPLSRGGLYTLTTDQSQNAVILVTYSAPGECDPPAASVGWSMENPSLVLAISKLAAAGEQAGFTLEQMIEMLDHGLEVETLLELICMRLHPAATSPDQGASRYRWVV